MLLCCWMSVLSLKATLGPGGKLLTNPLVAAQNFEYKMSNILDKPMESVFGFITVLPGAFSAYRYEALQGAPLNKYLKGQDLKKSDDDGIFNSNMYLAEDRILCFELVAKRDCAWLLKYVNTAKAKTDVPQQLHEFISQRRRWLNGSFFALLYSTSHFYQLFFTSHSIFRKFFLLVEAFYQFINLLVTWFALGSYFLVFRILTVYMADSDVDFSPGNVFSVLLLWLYLGSVVVTFVLSFGNKPKGAKTFYLIIVIFFAVLMVYMIFAAIFLAVKSVQDITSNLNGDRSFHYFLNNDRFRDLVIATSSTYVLYFVASFFFFEPWHMFTSFVQYLLLSPAYINVLQIYAFCNIHDISWGTKGEDKADDLGVAQTAKNKEKRDVFAVYIPQSKTQIDNGYKKAMYDLSKKSEGGEVDELSLTEKDINYFASVRSFTVLLWMLSNMIVVALITETCGLYQFTNDMDNGEIIPHYRSSVYLTVILWIVAFMAMFRFLGSS
ncbi:unnamed protein product [Ambrosiozyma monospora]|uniref:Unnamed protein product n=1 Tax=Ambrosiozyma monospora TaxID=43982 RepID=A0ACB5TDN6_AMBMO|nr:unnamed protein product [Ambrosiozyma monospora]